MKNTTILSKLQQLLTQIPAGKVTTYKALGEKLNIHPRQVGRLLHQNNNPDMYPCHRVVRSDLTLASGYAFGGREAQLNKLKKEGVQFANNGKVIE